MVYSIWFFKKNVLNDGTEKLFREICILLGAAAMKYDLCDHFVEQQQGNPYIEKKNILHPCFEICFPFTKDFEKCSCFVVLFLNFLRITFIDLISNLLVYQELLDSIDDLMCTTTKRRNLSFHDAAYVQLRRGIVHGFNLID